LVSPKYKPRKNLGGQFFIFPKYLGKTLLWS
jgi:hypothetical protein